MVGKVDKMNSSKNSPLHKIGDKMSVWYAPDMYNRNLYLTTHTPSQDNFKIEAFTGEVVDSKWIDNNKSNSPYGWLFTIKLDNGSYRSLYECKCTMMQKVSV